MNEYLNWTDEQLLAAAWKLKKLLPLAPAEIMSMPSGTFAMDKEIVNAGQIVERGRRTYELIKAEYYRRHPNKRK